MKNILLYLWQLPQNIVGLIVSLFYKTDAIIDYKDAKIRICGSFPGGISLANYIIVRRYPVDKYSKNSVKHEYGHSRQSLMLGPLYLIIIGIPSILWAAFYKTDPNNPNKYYEFYTESWADKLGEVTR